MARALPVRTFLAAAVVAGLAGDLTPARAVDPPRKPADDLLVEVRRLNEVAVQKLEAEVREGFAAANKLLAAEPDKAVDRLNQVRHAVEADTALTAARRETLLKQVATRVAEAEAKKKEFASRAAERDAKASAKSRSKLTADRYAAEQQDLKRTLERIDALHRLGKSAEAQAATDELIKKYPDEPVALILKQTTGTAERLAEARELLAEQAKRVTLAMRDVDRSALPPIGDIEFPKDWKEKSARRLKDKQLSPKEKAILEALAKPVTIKVKDTPFEEVIQYLSDAMGQPILLDKSDLGDADVRSDTPVTLVTPGRGLSTRTVLRKLLNEFNLTYVIQEGQIRVVSQTKARDMLTTAVYPVADLIRGTGAFGNAILWGPYVEQAQADENARAIVDTIEKTINPGSWRSGGGEGSITFHYPSMSLIVRQTAEVHMMLKGGMSR